MRSPVFSLILTILTSISVVAQSEYVPDPRNLQSREWFRDSKFGMFIHWGVYSVLGDGEWVMHNRQLDKQTYEHLAPFFNPVGFDPEAWVSLARTAGMKYITFTARHHDGFSMFDTKQSDWNIVERTPYGKDIVKMLADECRRQGIKLFLYYSHLDWYHDDYYPRGSTGQFSGRREGGDWPAYMDFINAQLTELLTDYGDIAGIWFDGMWDKREADWNLTGTYELIHSLQPQSIIGNNHHANPNDGEDFQMFEKDLPGQNRTGYRTDTEVSGLPLETCETINNSWGFNFADKNFKGPGELIHYLVTAAGVGGNFLLNVGPMPGGSIQPEFVSILKDIGAWMEKNGETIYGTRGGPIPPQSWGVSTRKNGKVFIHNLSGETSLSIPDFGTLVRNVYLFSGGESLDFTRDTSGMTVDIPPDKIDPIDTIVVLEY